MTDEVKWNKKCPNCGLFMAEHNKFCSLHCYEIYQMTNSKNGAVLLNTLLMVR